jgi:hypothetical protein
VSSPPYRYFQRKLKELSEPDKMKPQLVVLRLPDDFPQHFNYERVPELVCFVVFVPSIQLITWISF